MLEKAFEVLAVFKVVDEITKPINEMEEAVAGLKKSLENVSKSLEKLENAGKKIATFGAAITAPFAGAAYAAVEFEKTVVGEFNKVADLPKKQLAGFKKFFMDLSQQIPLSANEIAQLSANLAQMGVPNNQLKQFTEMVSKAAFAFDMMADEAGKAFGQIRSAYGIKTVEELKAIGDTINYLSNTMGANARDLVDIVKRVGGAAKQFGLSAKAVAVFGGVLRETGQEPEVAATALNFMLTRLQVLDNNMKEVLNTVGMTAEEFQELKKKSPEEAILKLLEAMKGLDEQTRAELLKKWVGQEHFGKIAVLINNLDRLKQKFAEIKAGKYVGSMDEEVKKLMQTTWAQFQVLKNQLQNLAIAIGSLLIPPLKTFVGLLTSAIKPITDFIQAHQTLAKVLIYPAVGIGLLLTALGSLMATIGFLGQGIVNFIAFMPALVSGLTAATGAVISFSTALLTNPITWIIAGIAGLVAAGYYLYKNWDTVSQYIKGIWQRVKEFFRVVFEKIEKIFQGVVSFFSTAWRKFVSIFLWINPITAPITALNRLVKFASGINLFEIGKQIIEGLWKGLVSMAKKPVEVIENIGHSIKEKFKSILGISSPSKLFMQFGHFLNEGLGLGLLKSLGLVKNAIGRVASVLHLPEIAPKIALEGIKTLALPAALIASLIPPANAQASLGKVLQADRTAVLPPVNVQITINNLTVGSKENAPAVAREIAQLTKAELKRLIKEIQEELERKRY